MEGKEGEAVQRTTTKEGEGKVGKSKKGRWRDKTKAENERMKGNFFGINETYMAYIVYTVA